MTDDEFQAWRAHPVTEVVDQHLRRVQEDIRASWAEGQNWTDEARFQVQNLEDLVTLTLDDINSYHEARENERNRDINTERAAAE